MMGRIWNPLYMEKQNKQRDRVRWLVEGLSWDGMSEFDKLFSKPDTLTQWEREFVESVEEKSTEGNLLTDRQMTVLEKIYKEKGR